MESANRPTPTTPPQLGPVRDVVPAVVWEWVQSQLALTPALTWEQARNAARTLTVDDAESRLGFPLMREANRTYTRKTLIHQLQTLINTHGGDAPARITDVCAPRAPTTLHEWVTTADRRPLLTMAPQRQHDRLADWSRDTPSSVETVRLMHFRRVGGGPTYTGYLLATPTDAAEATPLLPPHETLRLALDAAGPLGRVEVLHNVLVRTIWHDGRPAHDRHAIMTTGGIAFPIHESGPWTWRDLGDDRRRTDEPRPAPRAD